MIVFNAALPFCRLRKGLRGLINDQIVKFFMAPGPRSGTVDATLFMTLPYNHSVLRGLTNALDVDYPGAVVSRSLTRHR